MINRCHEKVKEETESRVVACNRNNKFCWTIGYNNEIIKGCEAGSASQSQDRQGDMIQNFIPSPVMQVLGDAVDKFKDSCFNMIKQKDGKDQYKASICTCTRDECNESSAMGIATIDTRSATNQASATNVSLATNQCNSGSIFKSSLKVQSTMSTMAVILTLFRSKIY